MTHGGGTMEDHGTTGAATRLRPLLPLVSIVVVNYNYGRYLAQALASVFAQTYPRIECVLVDNGSSDGSAEVIADAEATYSSLKVIRRASNAGQTAACVEGLAASCGPYVIFLDADDYLLPHCVAVHMQVHLTARVHAGFTSADMLQMVEDQMVLSTNEPMATYLRIRPRDDASLLRPTPAGLGELWASFDAGLAHRVYLIAPTQKYWVWSPTSGNCFRRDALALFCDGDGLEALVSQTDLLLATGINAITGSILIDEPLFVYRLHGCNAFSSRPQLSGTLSYEPAKTAHNNALVRRLLIDQLVSRVDRFLPRTTMTVGFLRTLHRLDVRDARGSYAAAAVIRNLAAVRRAGQGWLVTLFLLGKGTAPWTLWHARRRREESAR